MSVKLSSMAAGTVLLGVFLSPTTLTTAAGQTGGVATFTNQSAGAASTPATQTAIKAAALAVDSAGWTVFKKSADTRVIYVSSSRGDDRNDGLSESRPKKTIAAGYALLRSGSPDWLLLKRGDTWECTMPSLTKSGRGVTEKMLIGAYGSGSQRPRVNTGTAGAMVRGGAGVADVSHVAVVGLAFTPHQRTAANMPSGINFYGPGSDLLFEGNLLSGYVTNLIFDAPQVNLLSSVTIRRNVLVDAWSSGSHSQGIYAAKVGGLTIEENILDHNGWKEGVAGAERTIFNHNMYLQPDNTGLTVKDNIVCRGSATGIQIRGAGVAKGNVVIANPIGISLGHAQAPNPNTMAATADGNVVFDGGDIGSQPRGFAFTACNLAEARFVNNYVLSNTSSGSVGLSWWVDRYGQGVKKLVLESNVVDGWSGPIRIEGTAAQVPSILMRRNTFRGGSRPSQVVEHVLAETVASVTSDGNRFYSALPQAQWVRVASGLMSFRQWGDRVHDTTSSVLTSATSSAAPSSLEGFAKSRRLAATRDALFAALRAQAPGAWRADLTAPQMAQYLRSGR